MANNTTRRNGMDNQEKTAITMNSSTQTLQQLVKERARMEKAQMGSKGSAGHVEAPIDRQIAPVKEREQHPSPS